MDNQDDGNPSDDGAPLTVDASADEPKKLRGKRHSVVSGDEFSDVCAMVSQGLSANAACKELGISHRSFWNYLSVAPEEDLLVYSRAIRTRSLSFADKIDDVVNHVQRMAQGVHTGQVEPSAAQAIFNAGKLAVDAYRWTAARLMPQLYGETQNVNMSVSSHTQHLQALKDLTERGRQKLIARGVEPEIEVKAIPVHSESIPSTHPTVIDPTVEPALPYKHHADDDPAKLPPQVLKQRFVGELKKNSKVLDQLVVERTRKIKQKGE